MGIMPMSLDRPPTPTGACLWFRRSGEGGLIVRAGSRVGYPERSVGTVLRSSETQWAKRHAPGTKE